MSARTRPLRLATIALALSAGCGHAAPRPPYVRPSIVDPPAKELAADALSAAPAGAEAEPFVPAKVDVVTLSNGIRVQLVERHEYPVVTFAVVSDRGADDAPTGARALVPKALSHSAAGWTHEQLQRELSLLGALLDVQMTSDTTSVTVQAVSSDAARAIELVSDLVREPAYARDLAAVRPLALAAAGGALDAESALATRVAYQTVYPKGHPYHRDLTHELAAIRTLAPEALTSFHARAFAPNRLALIAAGNFERAPMLKLLEARFGTMAGRNDAPSNVPAAPAASKLEDGIVLVNQPGSAQAHIVIGRARAAALPSASRAALAVLDAALERALTSGTREAHGYTYGTHVLLPADRGPVLWRVEAAVDIARGADAVRDILHALEQISEGPLDDALLAHGRGRWRVSSAIAWQRTSGPVAILERLFAEGLSPDVLQTRDAEVSAVLAADVLELARADLAPGGMRVVVVGDAAKLRGPLRALNLGPVLAQ